MTYRCQLAKGRRGAREAAQRGDVIVVVDTLSFSTSAITAVHNGGIVFPCAKDEDPTAFAKRVNAEAAVGRPDVPQQGRFSLSPHTYFNIEPNTRIVLASPNGATCSRYARDVPTLIVGTLINARAAAKALTHIINTTDHAISLLSCGERWPDPDEDGPLRWALEDDLGVGAILSYLSCDKSPEARACEGTFLHLRDELSTSLTNCPSGRELCDRKFSKDVTHAAHLNWCDTVPVMRDERLERLVF